MAEHKLHQHLLFFYYYYYIPFFFFALFLTVQVSASGESSNSYGGVFRDTEVLLSFKSNLKDSTLLQTWQKNTNPRYFKGVTCNGTRVSSLDLSFVPLSLNFRLVWSSLMSLENLESLRLRFANLSGNLEWGDKGFGCSSVLSELDLSGNRLEGSISDLRSLSVCKGLKSLNLSRNLFGFSTPAKGVVGLGLESIDISFNQISGENFVSWVVSGSCEGLKFLSFKGNNIEGNIPLSNCPSLEHIDLSSNNFSGGIPVFGKCESLKYIDLSENKFTGELTGEIPSFSSENLQYLLLASNKFEGEIPLRLAGDCSALVDLDLSMNDLYGMVPKSLGSCALLESINLSTNNFTGAIPIETLLAMTKLKKLVLSYNQFGGGLPETLSKLANLEMLELSSNNITGSIPLGLCEANSLKELYLPNNLLTGTIPATISNCSKLVSLDLSFNYLKGTIPSSLGSLSQLKDLIMWLNQLEGEIPNELMYNSNRLSGEIPSWIGQLSNLAILKLGNNSFTGKIPPEIGECRSLIWLDLNSNLLYGSIPSTISKQSGNIAVGLVTGKRYVYLKNDGSTDCRGAGNLLEFAGIRQDGLNRVPTRRSCNFTRIYIGNTQYTFDHNGSMIFLDLSYNMLQGSIPKEIGEIFYLSVLNLGHNNLSGPIPPELGYLKNVGILDLSHNKLDGLIPSSLSGLSLLSEIDLSNNNLSGPIPETGQLATFPSFRYLNNTGLCGYPLNACGDSRSNTSYPLHRKSHRRQASVAGSIAMGLLFSLFCVFGLILVLVERKKRRKKNSEAVDIYVDSRSHSGTATGRNWAGIGSREALSINLAAFDKPLRKLTFADLLNATNGFHDKAHIGSGGFGDVYKAQLKDGNVVAVKKLIQVSGQGDREFTAEMETIGKIKHRNLVPLLGYCKVGEERLLVYEYMKFGSLEDVLHDRRKAGIKLNWSARRKIAVGAARGLAFLHHNCIPHIIHRDMKSSNVLLDENLEARVSDFGMARMMSVMDTHLSVSTLAGTPGYVPPEYYQSFRCSTKGDVYSYGVVLLELLTGRQPTDSPDFGDNNLVGWVKQHAKLKISDVFDKEIMKEDPSLVVELLEHLNVACACLDDRHWRRPTMIQVMTMFKEIQAGSGIHDSSATTVESESFGVVEMSIKESSESIKP
ncbi:hypothetical protein GIB67_024981 [Kingdonia uniflora]|uniref:non-specific serine/threonine protein kinase n=1 Tax=Kingdonia uniflora TaxID=39325 RepID=A0A7J7LQA9_9MAGN|nr:hypothetical protein GIB67_024981 [Kingdonia uniflora]